MEISDNGQDLTEFSDVCSILSELWMDYRKDKEFVDFISYNDMGLPLAFFIDSELVEPTELAKQYVLETWRIFLAALNITEDIGWKSLDDLFSYADNRKDI